MHLRNNSLIFAMGIAIMGWLLNTAQANAQPRRDRRENQVAQIAAQTAQPACTPEDANVARQHRGAGLDAFEAHEWQACVAEYTVAQARCATPEAGFNLAYCLENLGQLAQAIEGYEALLRGARLPAEVTADQLRRTIESVRARLPRVVTPVIVPSTGPVCTAHTQTDVANCGRCGNRCASGQVCTAGACRAVIATPPVTNPMPSRTAPLVMIVSGGALTIAGGVILGIGVAARSAADADEATLARSGCSLPSRPASCANYQAGATTPASVAAWATPLGGALLGLGAIDTVVGAVWYARAGGRTATERPHLSGWYTPSGGGLSLTGTF